MGLDEEQTQHAALALDVNSSLIYIEATGESAHVLPLAAWRICRQVRFHKTVFLLEKGCALALPATPFSGAQAVANRISLLLAEIPCALHVYHGATALLVLQHLRETGIKPVSREVRGEMPARQLTGKTSQAGQTGQTEFPSNTLPYLAFLTSYPSPRLLRLFPYELACRYQCVPLGAERKQVTLATRHWLNREVIAQLNTATQREIFQVRCEVTIIDEVLRYWQHIQEVADQDRAALPMEKACSSSR